jgi:hypothetical protein
LALQHHRVLGLVDIIGVLLLDALDVGLGLDAVVLGESALVSRLWDASVLCYMYRPGTMTYSAGISQEVRANRLDVAVGTLTKLANGLEVLLASPALGQDR